ncbi:sugar phosphate nucleotidyltransferase [Undibacterium sp.]|uniref:phosphocholine cytidylyltransferase family protein n=1 Tax=Undibacterium sp. TaxID=1914977 RepID=UPI00374CE370
MNIIILAAGRGERLMPLTQNTPKPLIDMGNGNTLLEQQMLSIQQSGAIKEATLVVGYLAEQIEAKMRAYRARGFHVHTLYNPFWQQSNNLMSLWLARQVLEQGDVMITNGDNIFTPDVFAGLAEQGEGIWLSACEKTEFDSDDMKVTLKDGLVARVAKTIPAEEASVESPGLVMVKGARARELFIEQLEGAARDDGSMNRFWLEVFNRMWTKGVPVKPWIFESAGRWQEIDFHIDVQHVRQLLHEKLLNLHSGDKE